MDPLRLLAERDGYFTRADARQAGYDDRAVAREVRSRRWRRIRRGYYSPRDLWEVKSPEERHLALTGAVLDSLGDAVVASHVSGALLHGMAVWGVSLDRVHVTRLDGGQGRIDGDVVHHEGFVDDGEIMEVRGRRVLSPVRCAVETGLIASPESALVTFCSGLHLYQFGERELEAQCEVMSHWPRMQHLHVPRRMATPGAQSVGESRGLWFFWVHHLPRPELQCEVRDHDGSVIGTTDWVWHSRRTYGEFDGRVKYGRLLRPGQSPGDAVFQEKRREDRIRETSDYRMIRLIWSDYDSPRATASRLRLILGDAA